MVWEDPYARIRRAVREWGPRTCVAGYARPAFLERNRVAAADRAHETIRLTRPSGVRYACLGAG